MYVLKRIIQLKQQQKQRNGWRISNEVLSTQFQCQSNGRQQQQTATTENTSSINNKSKRFLQILINNTRLDIVYVRASPALFLSLSPDMLLIENKV